MIEVELSTISCLVPAIKKSLFSSLGDKSSILVLFGFRVKVQLRRFSNTL